MAGGLEERLPPAKGNNDEAPSRLNHQRRDPDWRSDIAGLGRLAGTGLRWRLSWRIRWGVARAPSQPQSGRSSAPGAWPGSTGRRAAIQSAAGLLCASPCLLSATPGLRSSATGLLCPSWILSAATGLLSARLVMDREPGIAKLEDAMSDIRVQLAGIAE